MTSHYIPHTHTKIPTLVFPTNTQAARHVALMIESLIRQNNSAGRPTVLGLATGSTPVGLYRELIRLHKEAGLDFSRVVTFNLDEYYPMSPDDAHSYQRWLVENKAPISPNAVEEEMSEVVAASFLQMHNDTEFFLEHAAVGYMELILLPLVVVSVNWTPNLFRRVVIWLSLQVGKGLLKLDD